MSTNLDMTLADTLCRLIVAGTPDRDSCQQPKLPVALLRALTEAIRMKSETTILTDCERPTLAALHALYGQTTAQHPEILQRVLEILGPAIDQPDPNQTNPLTNREREILRHIADGFSNKEIAAILSIGVRTIETHRERVMRKLNIHNVAGLTRYAIKKGLTNL